MVTGDNPITAKNIAQKCGIYHPDQGGLVMEGPEFRKLKDKEHELNAVIFKLDVCWGLSCFLAPYDPRAVYANVEKLAHL